MRQLSMNTAISTLKNNRLAFSRVSPFFIAKSCNNAIITMIDFNQINKE